MYELCIIYAHAVLYMHRAILSKGFLCCDYSAVVNSAFVLAHLCVLMVMVAELGEEQELDLSPRRKRRALGPPARGLSGVWLPGQR